MAENDLQQVTETLQEQNKMIEDQNDQSDLVIMSIGERIDDLADNIQAPLTAQASRTGAVVEKLSIDIQQQAKKSVEGLRKKATDTIENAPKLAMAQLDPVTATLLGQAGEASKNAFNYIKSFGSVIKGKDEEQKEEQDQTQEEINEAEDAVINAFDNLDDSINDGFDKLLAFLQGESLDELESRREAREAQQLSFDAPDEQEDDDGDQKENILEKLANFNEVLDGMVGKLGKILFVGLTPVAAAIGVVVGLIQGYGKELRLIGKTLSSAANAIGKVFSVQRIGGAFTGIIDTYRSVVERIRSAFTSLTTVVSNMMKPITGAVNKAKAAGGFLSNIFSGLSRLGSIVTTVSGVVSKLFVPLRFIMVGFSTLKGALDGFKEGGILGGIQGAVTGFFTSLVGVPLDLIKGMTSWVLEKLGFDKAAAFLESFSFSDIIKDIIALPYNLLRGAKDFIVDKLTSFSIGDFFGNIANTASNFMRDLLRGVLPDPSVDRGFIKNLAVKAIPNDLYRIAGINPETGEIEAGSESEGQLADLDNATEDEDDRFGGDRNLQRRVDRARRRNARMRANANNNEAEVSRSSAPQNVQSGDQLQLQTAARRAAELEQQQAVSGGAGGNVNVASNVVNNSNTTLQNRPPASSQPDNMSDTMMAAGFAP